jgi:uncharacterized protein (DUF305 family)
VPWSLNSLPANAELIALPTLQHIWGTPREVRMVQHMQINKHSTALNRIKNKNHCQLFIQCKINIQNIKTAQKLSIKRINNAINKWTDEFVLKRSKNGQ